MLAQAGGADARKGGSVFRARLSITFLAAGAHSLFEVRSCSYSASLDDDHDSGGRVVDFRPSFEGKRKAETQWSGGLLGVLNAQMEDFNKFHREWYIDVLISTQI